MLAREAVQVITNWVYYMRYLHFENTEKVRPLFRFIIYCVLVIPVFFVITGSLTVVNKLIGSDWSGGELYGTVTYYLAQLGFYALKIIYFIFGFKMLNIDI